MGSVAIQYLDNSFALMLVGGMSQREEPVAHAL